MAQRLTTAGLLFIFLSVSAEAQEVRLTCFDFKRFFIGSGIGSKHFFISADYGKPGFYYTLGARLSGLSFAIRKRPHSEHFATLIKSVSLGCISLNTGFYFYPHSKPRPLVNIGFALHSGIFRANSGADLINESLYLSSLGLDFGRTALIFYSDYTFADRRLLISQDLFKGMNIRIGRYWNTRSGFIFILIIDLTRFEIEL